MAGKRYRAIQCFADLRDDERLYQAGDVYPRLGLEVSEERLEELAGYGNLRGEPVIERIMEDPETETPDPEPDGDQEMEEGDGK